ncbi:Electrogenic sodium bicarbonate cotransporter 1 [Trichinella patagoniensis]|uniref:Anion exchange protein n=1 Tax=Trichinella patagoniensis TaxID=990121 RepID=A0A0V1A7R2_9BILA|nr:Electrogenic sodium bicarbonate cotransporter 1 [Trichinella patagoniensis]
MPYGRSRSLENGTTTEYEWRRLANIVHIEFEIVNKLPICCSSKDVLHKSVELQSLSSFIFSSLLKNRQDQASRTDTMSHFVRKISASIVGTAPRKDTAKNMAGDFLVDPFYSGQTVHAGYSGRILAERIRSMIESEDLHEKTLQSHPLFCEMLVLKEDFEDDSSEKYSWNEKSRWIKYEERVEEGERWSKPHISLLEMESLLQLKSCLKNCNSSFNAQVESYPDLVEVIVESWSKQSDIPKNELKICRSILLAKKHHLRKQKLRIGDIASGESFLGLLDHQPDGGENSKSSSKPATPPPPKAAQSNLLRKIPKDTEGASILIGYVKGISKPMAHFTRLAKGVILNEMFEIPIQLRFIFVLLLPSNHTEQCAQSIGTCLGALFADEIFSKVCYKAQDCKDLAYAVDEFTVQSIILPAGKWNLSIRLEPPEGGNLLQRTIGKPKGPSDFSLDENMEKKLKRTGRIFGGLIEDVKEKAPWFISDFTDAFKGRVTQTIAAAIFLFFANISKIITFGGVMDHGTIENVLAGGICGVIYAIFSGQPICVLSATGPCLVFETILHSLCKNQGWNFLCVRFWVGAWTAVFLLIFVALDASVMVSWITRFTEEAFATLISLIFLVKAVEELFAIVAEYPILPELKIFLNDTISNGTNGMIFVNRDIALTFPEEIFNHTIAECLQAGHDYQNGECIMRLQVFLFSIVLFFATFAIAFALKWFRHSGIFSSWTRNIISDFNVTIAVALMTLTNWYSGLNAPCLHVPDRFIPTTNRSWFINPLHVDPWWIGLAAGFPALLFSLLILMDQNITSKGFGYHLDLFVIAFLMLICASMGIPFYVAATVISLMHMESLRIVSEIAAPGEKPAVLGIKEQRVTAVIAHLLIGFSIFLTPLMKLIPIPALLGIFLYMGIVSLIGQQFIQRILIVFMPTKHQPDYPWLRMVPLRRIHLFTAIQVVSFVLLAIVEEMKLISMVFPMMLVVLICIRKFFLGWLFTDKELKYLDDELPSWNEVMRPTRINSCVKNNAESIIIANQKGEDIQLLPPSPALAAEVHT